MRKIVLLLFTSCIIFLNAFTQDIGNKKIVVAGKIIDATTQKAVSGVNVQVINSNNGTSTQVNGNFSLVLDLPKDSFPIQLKFSHVSFDDFFTSIDYSFDRTLDVKLLPKILSLNAVEIYSGPQKLASPYFSQIIDYEVFDNKIVLLENLDKSRKNRIRIVDFQGNLLGETIVKGKPISLFKDCRDEVYLIMYNRYLKIHYDIDVTVTVSSQNLENRINNPCRVITDSFLIYEEYGYARLLSWFLKRNSTDRYSTLFYYSADKQTIRLIQEDLLVLKERYGNIIQDLMYLDANLENTEENRIRNLVLDEDLSESLFYKPNYCPIFKEKDRIIAFDHGHNLIVNLNYKGEITDRTKINYQKKLAWEPQVFQDEKQNNYFTIMNRGGWSSLYKIDVQTGLATKYHKIENIFPEKIKLYNGYLLYLFRQPRTPDRYSLYFEKY